MSVLLRSLCLAEFSKTVNRINECGQDFFSILIVQENEKKYKMQFKTGTKTWSLIQY